MNVFRLACSRVGQSKLFQAVLIVIEKLVSCDLLIGNAVCEESVMEDSPPVSTPVGTPPLSDRRIIDLIVELVCSKLVDEETQLLQIKCILSLALTREVHGTSLMMCVRTLFSINKDSKSVTTQSTAVTSLTQILNRLVLPQSLESGIPRFAISYTKSILHKTVLLTDPDNLKMDNRGKHGWCSNCGNPANFFSLSHRISFCGYTCKRLCGSPIVPSFHSTDLIMVFTSLCKLAGGPATAGIPDPRIVKAKRLSLDLISSMLERGKLSLCKNATFIEILKKNLFMSLITNSVSPISSIFTVSLQILNQLISEFKTELWPEIGLFIDQVFLCILDSPNATMFHKTKVIQLFRSKLCCDCVSAIELFQLFDCNLDERNVFELCIAALARMELQGLAALVDLIDSAHAWTKTQPKETPSIKQENRSESPDSTKQRKTILQDGIVLFGTNPKKGLEYLSLHDFLVLSNPSSVAEFLKRTNTLNKTSIGEIFGDPSYLNVFQSYLESVDIAGMDLDVALRRFLAQFRLPGEAQKIDRIMEKFAEKYTRENPGRYPSADSAYVLSFAVIMLNTDLHSDQVKKKMSMDEFVKLGKGISAEIEIDPQELARLYRNIQAEEISLTDEPIQTNFSEKNRFENFLKETGLMIERSKKSLIKKKHPQITIATINDIPAMFSVIIGSLCTALKSSRDENVCEAVKKLCEIAIFFDSELIGIPSFSLLVDLASFSVDEPLSETQIAALDAVFKYAPFNAVGHRWEKIAQIASQIDKLTTFSAPSNPGTKYSLSKYFSPQSPSASPVALANAQLVDPNWVDALVLRSGQLSPSNLLSLLHALIEVSEKFELAENRLFTCQKIAEICDFNMGRIRLVWTKIWTLVSPYFVRLAGNSVLFAIDSLRQLALKFLSKPELENYHFQSEFLKPFHQIFSQQCTLQVQELILSVLESLVQTVSLKSGWISVFATLRLSANLLPVQTFAILSLVPASVQDEYFQAYINIVIALIANRRFEPEIAPLWQTLVAKYTSTEKSENCMHLSQGLAVLVVDPRGEIRERAVSIMFDGVFPENKSLDFETIQIFLRAVLTPLFDETTLRLNEQSAVQVLTIMLTKLGIIVDEKFEFFSKLIFELISIFSILINNVEVGEKVSAVGTNALRRLLVINYESIETEEWRVIVDAIARLMTSTTPADLIIPLDAQILPFQSSEMVTRCVAQLNLIQVVQEIIACAELQDQPGLASVEDSAAQLAEDSKIGTPTCATLGPSIAAKSRLIQSLESSYDFALRFNGELQLRTLLKSLGFMKDLRQLPGLLKQERLAISTIIRICFLSSLEFSDRLCKYSNQVVQSYLSKEAQLHTISPQASLSDEIEREIGGLIPLVTGIILGGVLSMRKEHFEFNKGWIYLLLVKLVASNNYTIRANVQKCLYLYR